MVDDSSAKTLCVFKYDNTLYLATYYIGGEFFITDINRKVTTEIGVGMELVPGCMSDLINTVPAACTGSY